MIDLGLFFLIVWMIQNAAVDVSCAIKGTENPRYALKKQKALAAGKTAANQPRYGSRDWFADLLSDGLAAQTERRRVKAAEKVQAAVEANRRDDRPLDDLAEAVREEPQRPAPARVDTEQFPEFESSVVHDAEQHAVRVDANRGRGGTACEHCGRRVNVGYLYPRTIDGQNKRVCVHCAGLMEFDAALVVPVPVGHPLDKDGLYFTLSPDGKTARSVPLPWKRGERYYTLSLGDETAWPVSATTDTGPDAVIIPFPNPKSTVKEISMATSEVNGLTTALAFAQAAADAHNSFATGGSEGYTGALAGWEVGDRCVGLAREAQEASQIAAAKWVAHVEALEEQLKVKEAYQGAPDAGNKQFLLNG